MDELLVKDFKVGQCYKHGKCYFLVIKILPVGMKYIYFSRHTSAIPETTVITTIHNAWKLSILPINYAIHYGKQI